MTQVSSFRFRSRLALIAAATLAVASPSFADTVVFGDPSPPGIGDCTPSCTPQFQTVYSHSLFGTDPVSISGITYFLGSFGADNSQAYTIRLSTSANPVGSLSSTFADNIGADVATFYFGVPVVGNNAGALFTFSGTPFLYNPNAGDLLVDIAHEINDNTVYSSYADVPGGSTDRQRVYAFSTTGTGFLNNPGTAIATQFTVSPAAIPEPATWAMMIIGFGASGTMIRRRRIAKA